MRQIDFLKSLGQLRFTGQLVETDLTGQQWTIYLVQGKIAYATGGQHRVRRWRRNLITHCPLIPTYRLAWQIDLAKVIDDELIFGWEYALLKLWVTQQRITQEQAERLIRATVTEILFDIIQAGEVKDQLYRHSSLLLSFGLFEIEDILLAAEAEWQNWQQTGLATCSPNAAPVIKQPEKFQQWLQARSQTKFMRLINGQRSLREIATESRQDVLETTSSLSTCIQLGYLDLSPIADLPGLVFQREAPKPSVPIHVGPKALIACIDDSLMVRKMMEELLTSSGYQFIGIEDPIRALGILLARKPQFIFLDLVMPNANGYEICEKLRKLACFRHTPIVILTSNDGYANRLRSNFVGATDFLSKPLNAEAVLGMISRHLKPVSSELSIPTQSL